MTNRAPHDQRRFLGVGWSFPVVLQAGEIKTTSYEEDVRQAILLILQTNRGERLMRPDFGAGMEDFVFSQIGATTAEEVRTRVREALIDWEPRIDVLDVRVDADSRERNLLQIRIQYRVRATNTDQNLVYPFYLHEGSGK